MIRKNKKTYNESLLSPKLDVGLLYMNSIKIEFLEFYGNEMYAIE